MILIISCNIWKHYLIEGIKIYCKTTNFIWASQIIKSKSPITSRSVFWLRHISEYAPTACHLACWINKHLFTSHIITNTYHLYGDSCDALLTTSLKNSPFLTRFAVFWVHFGAPRGIFHTALVQFWIFMSHFFITWINDSTHAFLSSI